MPNSPSDHRGRPAAPAPYGTHRAGHRRLVLLVLLAVIPGLLGGFGPADARAEERTDQHASPATGKVFNGVPASIADLPWVVAIQSPSGSCTGTVVSAQWVLSAGHCFSPGDVAAPERVQVGIGGDSLAAGFAEVTRAAQVVIHPAYHDDRLFADVALVRLARPTTTPAIPLVPAGFADPVGARAIITGWGMLDERRDTDRLMRAEVPVLSDTACGLYGGFYDPATFVCAGGQGIDVCSGDSGGPLVLTSGGGARQLGIVSFGEPCGPQSSTVGAYTAVAAYRTWIDQVMASAGPPDPGPTGFWDVALGTTHAPTIMRVAEAEIAGGFSDGSFRPGVAVTRAQMATFVQRATGLAPGALPTPFPDVPSSVTHAAAISAVSAAQIAGGFPDGTYRPEQPVTRGQMATFLVRAASIPAATGPAPFTDVPADHVHAVSIAAVHQAGIAAGVSATSYQPNAPVTRGQMATFLARAFLDAPTAPEDAGNGPDGDGPDGDGPDGDGPAGGTDLADLVAACAADDVEACDELYRASEPGTAQREFGDTCGERIPAGTGRWCVDAFADPLVAPCITGDFAVCDQLWRESERDTWEAVVADTCGFRQPEGTGRWCVEAFG